VKRENLVAGLDVGSTKTCAVIAEIAGTERAPMAKILGVGLARTTGVRRGVVRDIEETTRAVASALRDAERMAGVRVPAVYCGVATENVRTQLTKGLVSVAADEIRPQDVRRVHEVALSVSLGEERELLIPIPQEYTVDKQGGINDPIGMTGMRLEVEMRLVAVHKQAAQNLKKSVERAGYRVTELVLEPLAAAQSVLTEEEKELGCALVELGGGSTTVAIFHDDKLRHLSSDRCAGSYVTSDLVQGLSVTQTDAERLKERWGVAYTPLVDQDDMVELPGTPGQGARQAKRELIAHIIHQRLDEIFGRVLDQIEHAGYAGRLSAGIVLTGGGAHLAGIVELGRDVFAMPVRKGVPERDIKGLVDSVQAPRYAVPVGLALYGVRSRAQADTAGDTAVDRMLGPVKRWLQEFF
jgi:cell division protein FtsA